MDADAPDQDNTETDDEGEDDLESDAPKKPSKDRHPLFADETVPTFFRRLAWSPDGSFLVTPTGLLKEKALQKAEFVSHIFVRHALDR